MAKTVTAGQMRTQITVKRLTSGVDADGFPTETWEPVFSAPVRCLWVNAHGSEVFEHLRMDLKEVATITTRYSPLIDVRCRIWHESDPLPYEIISIDNVEDARRFLEIKVRRAVTA